MVDDGSTRRDTRRTVERAVARRRADHGRMLDENAGISAATNRGLELCRGELVAFLDHDDALTPDALLRVARGFAEHRVRRRLLRPGQDHRGAPVRPVPQARLVAGLRARRDVRRPPAGRAPGADLRGRRPRLRASTRSRTSSCCCGSPSARERIHHIPEMLYHWRAIPGSIAVSEHGEGRGDRAAGAGGQRAPAPPRHRGRGRSRTRRSPIGVRLGPGARLPTGAS